MPSWKQTEVWILVFVLFAVLAECFLLVFRPQRVCFGDACLRVELAATPAAREQGLMHRERLAPARGMLFVFPKEDFWPFWMKDTRIPLDILWLDANRKVVDMVEGARPFVPAQDAAQGPPVFNPVFRSRYVLEANAGWARKNSVKIGDRARFEGVVPLEGR